MRKLLLSLVGVAATVVPALSATRTYQRCTDPADLLNPDNIFLMVVLEPNSQNIYGATTTTATTLTNVPTAVVVEDSGTLPDQMDVDAEALGLGKFSVHDNGDFKVLYESVEDKYWGLASFGMYFANPIPTSASSSKHYQETLSLNEDGGVLITSESATDSAYGFRWQKSTGAVVFMYLKKTNLDSSTSSIYKYYYPVFYKEVIVETAVEEVQIDCDFEHLNPVVSLSCPTEGAEIFYGFSEDVIDTPYTAPFSVTENCIVYAKAKVGDEESLISSMTVNLPYTSFKEAIENAGREKIRLVGDFEVIANSNNKTYTILTDGETNMLLYNYNTALPPGTKVSYIYSNVETVFSQLCEFTNAEITLGGNGASCQPREINSLSEIDIDRDLYDEIIMKGCQISEKVATSSYSTATAVITFEGETVALYNVLKADFEEGENFDITGIVWRNKDVLQIAPISVTEGVFIPSVANPVIKPNKRELDLGDEVSITCATEGANIYYTLDDSEPTKESTLYTDPFTFEGDVTVKARAYYESDDKEMKPSEVVSRFYHVFDPTCNVITADGHEVEGVGSYIAHTCTIDKVDYATNTNHDPNRGLQMNNTDTRNCYLIQTGENEGYVLDSIVIDFNDDVANADVSLIVRGSNTPFRDGTVEGTVSNVRTNGVRVGTITTADASISFEGDYKYFSMYPDAQGSIYMNSITINYREPAPVQDAPELADELGDDIDYDDENEILNIPALTAHSDWVPMYQVNEGNANEADPEGTAHSEALDPATLHFVKIWYEHSNGINKSETKVYYHLTTPRVAVDNVQPDSDNPVTTIDFGTIGEGVIVYFTLNGTAPVASESVNNVRSYASAADGVYNIESLADLDAVHTVTAATKVVKISHIEGETLPEIKLVTRAVHPEAAVESKIKYHEDTQITLPTGIEDINAADAAEAIYFNLQGVQVANPENGTYIRIANGKAEKVMK